MKRFFNDLKRYWSYIKYSTWAELKTEIIDSYLGWLWLILEPLCFMLIYTFIAVIVFNSKMDYFPVFVFIGLTIWNFFNKMVVTSVKLVSNNRDTVTKVYLPKFVLLFIKMGVNIFKMGVSFLLIVIFMIFYKVPITINILWIIPIVITTVVFTFGVSSIVMHFGVFIEDLVNLINIFLKLVFYMTGIFYDIPSKLHNVFYKTILLDFNPLANIIYNLRRVMIYSSSMDGFGVAIWLLVGILLSVIGINTIYKYENTYVKVMR
jgi:ABC-type polysaccharide/polyol phosphate export permease